MGITVRTGTIAVLLAVLTSGSAAANSAPAPTYAHTIGHPAHASMYPSGLDVDPSGIVYVADTGNDQVAAYRPDGSQLWRVGTRGTKALGRFSNPRDIAYLGGKLYVADLGYNRVQVLNASNGGSLGAWGTRFSSVIGISAGVDGAGNPVILTCDDVMNKVSEFTPSGSLIRTMQPPFGNAPGQLNAPRDADTDSAGNIYVADYANDRVAKFSPTGAWITSWGTHGTANGQFKRPYGVTVDASNRVYAADSDNERIQKFTASGGYLFRYGSAGTGLGQFQQLRRVAVGPGSSPLVYGADLWDNHVDRFLQGGGFDKRYAGVHAALGGFNEPSGLAVDGSTFVADSVNQRIQRFTTTTGSFDLAFGERGWGAKDLSGFNWPRDIAINAMSGTVWVADTKNNRVTQFTRNGTATGRVFGTLGSGVGQLHWPYAVASTGQDVVVADTWNSRIQRWSTNSLAAAWTATGFNFPRDVAVLGSTVYVADTNNNRVVELSAGTGAVLKTIAGIPDPEGIAVTPAGTIWRVRDRRQPAGRDLAGRHGAAAVRQPGIGARAVLPPQPPRDLRRHAVRRRRMERPGGGVQAERFVGRGGVCGKRPVESGGSTGRARPRGFMKGGEVLRTHGSIRCAAPLMAMALVALASSPQPVAAAVTPPPAPTYSQTIGGPAHATMYPSGVDAHNGVVYIADTGNDQVAAYRSDGSQKWRVGVRGPKRPGSFDNPRDIAYLNGRLYVADTGFNRVQVLDATNGAWVATWPHTFGSVIGIGAGPDGHGGSLILTAEDDRNTISEWTPSGELIRSIVAPLGNADGQLNEPRDADTDSRGNIYVADYANDRMVKFGPRGGWRRNWGTKGSGNGQFGRPYGVAVDASDNVYVADSNNERIQKFTKRGVYLAKWGSPGDGPGQFTQLRRVAVGAGLTPNVYGADLWGNHISRFTQDGTFALRYGTDHPALGGFNEPSGLAVDSSTFVADTVNQRVERFTTSSGAFELSWGDRGWEKADLTGFNWPRDVTINQVTGSVWVADTRNNRITQFTRNGTPTGRVFGHLGSDADSLHWPFGITSIGQDVVVADTFNNRVERLDASGLTVQWSATGLHAPRDVTVAGGIVYVADSNGNQVVELDGATGEQVGSFGGLHNPQGIAVAANGTIWVADTASNRLVEYAADGTKLQTLGATGGATGTAHGNFNHPTHVEIANGKLYVADEYNDRIEVFTLND